LRWAVVYNAALDYADRAKRLAVRLHSPPS